VLQEQNSFAGITNKWLAKYAKRIFVAYEGMERFFPPAAIRLTGNPVRPELTRALPGQEESRAALGLIPDRRTLLVLGGSLGARRINELIAMELRFLVDRGFQVLWQCGKGYLEQYEKHNGPQVQVRAFIRDMSTAFAAADLIISRAGAGSVSELCLVGKPVIFIPSPNVAEDHQRKNASAIVAKQAALMLLESELDEQFEKVFEGLTADDARMNSLGRNIRKLAKPEATREIVDELETLLRRQNGAE
jgi:UDP-N-acetylglucosamine--N-acetylmuramyl-(pentapeptide) pyrophosphoryl-undecaprenol N-acetylglucosamine transferase